MSYSSKSNRTFDENEISFYYFLLLLLLQGLYGSERQTSEDQPQYPSRYGSATTPDSGIDSRAGTRGRAEYEETRFEVSRQHSRTSPRTLPESISSPPPERSLRTASRPSDYDTSEGFSYPSQPERQPTSPLTDDLRRRDFQPPRTPTYETYPSHPELRTLYQDNSASAQIQASPTRSTSANNPRVCTIDINIAINVGRGSQPTVTAQDGSTPIPVHTTTSFIDNVRNIDIDFRLPKHTARISTDGIERSPRNQ